MASYLVPVPVCTACTVAPGKPPPCASRTLPARLPVVTVWAVAGPEDRAMRYKTTSRNIRESDHGLTVDKRLIDYSKGLTGLTGRTSKADAVAEQFDRDSAKNYISRPGGARKACATGRRPTSWAFSACKRSGSRRWRPRG